MAKDKISKECLTMIEPDDLMDAFENGFRTTAKAVKDYSESCPKEAVNPLIFIDALIGPEDMLKNDNELNLKTVAYIRGARLALKDRFPEWEG